MTVIRNAGLQISNDRFGFNKQSAKSSIGWNWQGSLTTATTTFMQCVGPIATPPDISTKL